VNIYVGNLSFDCMDSDLKKAFEAHGQVESARVIADNYTGKSRGFGFVEMPNDAEARAAIAELNGKELAGREIKVNEARPKAERSGSGPRGGGGGGRERRW
jgi:RNA recognition motif-containing protein